MNRVLNCSDYLRSKGHTLFKWSQGWKARSPFSEDKNPSLMIWEHPEAEHRVRSEHWYDFSNSVGGDVYRLVQLVEECSFSEAVSIVGCPPPEREFGDECSVVSTVPLPDFTVPQEADRWILIGEMRARYLSGLLTFDQVDQAYYLIRRGVTSCKVILHKILSKKTGKCAD